MLYDFSYICEKYVKMTKAEIVSEISIKTGVEKTTAMAVVEAFMNEVRNSVGKKESVFLRGFGTFKAKKRAKKTARNISTNTALILEAHYVPSFKPSKKFVKSVKENNKVND